MGLVRLGLPAKQCDYIYIGAMLHDIGKIGLPETILLKPGRLSESEFEIIKRHPVIGYEILKFIPYFRIHGILDTVMHHHERFDGGGYPSGLRGDAIPLSARIVAVADSFDAMTTMRVYSDRMGIEYAVSQLEAHSGTQFDPLVVNAFLEVLEQEQPAVARRYEHQVAASAWE